MVGAPPLTDLECLLLPCLVLEPEEQLGTLQLLIYLLPPCNCDTLHRLLQFLSMVARHANDNVSKDGQEVGTPPPAAALHAGTRPLSPCRRVGISSVTCFTWRKGRLPFPALAVHVERELVFSPAGQFLRAHGPLTSCVSRRLPNEAVIFPDGALLKTLNLRLYEEDKQMSYGGA